MTTLKSVFPRRPGAETTQSYSKEGVLHLQALGRSAERLLEIGPELVDLLEADGEAQQAGRNAPGLPAGAALHRRVGASEAGRVQDQARAGLDGARVRDVEGDDAAEPGIAHGRDARVPLEAVGELGRARGVPGHALVERLEPAQQRGGCVRRSNDPAVRAQLAQARALLRVTG